MLNLKRFREPASDVETSAGRIYLYPLRMPDMTDFRKLEPGNAVSQIRAFLPSIGSLTLVSKDEPERVPLDADAVKGLSDEEIERISDAYEKSYAWQTIREESYERNPVTRQEGETAVDFLVRLLNAEIDDYHRRTKRVFEKNIGSARSIFDQVRKSSSALSSTLSAYENLKKSAAFSALANASPTREAFDKIAKSVNLSELSGISSELNELGKITQPASDLDRIRSKIGEPEGFSKSLNLPSMETLSMKAEHFNPISNLLVEQARERAEERTEEMALARLTGKMTAESATALKDLVEAATTLMDQMNERDKKYDRSTSKQITIAVWSVGLTAALALLTLIVSMASFFQIQGGNASSDQ
ncbi:MAG: hypothetical protein LBF16_13460 [Pseudomonadales bacterium]|jgi:hypothetical protein|nr:hypothetical protein [Pseudomonadales bacterium]